MRYWRALILGLLYWCASSSLYAWSLIGHQQIAALAWQYLSPDTKMQLGQILATAPPCMRMVINPSQDPETQFIRVSTWPDMVRNFSGCALYEQSRWHYRDTYWRSDTLTNTIKKADHAINLKHSPKSNSDQDIVQVLTGLIDRDRAHHSLSAIELAWLIHLIGDIHQPLHLSSRVSANSPRGDSGGNGFSLLAECQKCSAVRVKNLHQYWDRLLDTADDTNLISSRIDALRQMALAREQKYRMVLKNQAFYSVTDGTQAFEQWAQDSAQLAQKWAYPQTLIEGSWPSEAYLTQAQSIAAQQAVLASYRLSDTLNFLLSSAPK